MQTRRIKGYRDTDLIRVAKRENNTKRAYLIVNPLQGKHVPVLPSAALDLYKELGRKVEASLTKEESVLVIAFAETATAIGAGVAAQVKQVKYLIHTTRESAEGAKTLYFTESHSHATDQFLRVDGLEEVLVQVDRVLFVEDEVTTGNTILHLIEQLQQQYPEVSVRYMIASILNGMRSEHLDTFSRKKIPILFLKKTENQQYESLLSAYQYEGKMEPRCLGAGNVQAKIYHYGHYQNLRVVQKNEEYQLACEAFAKKIVAEAVLKKGSKVLVLGTEEFMYPALVTAAAMEADDRTKAVRFHATTRSPILVSGEKEYPLHSRSELTSLYAKDRTTYIYNFDHYDQVFLITDASPIVHEGLDSLLHALVKEKNTDISLIQWVPGKAKTRG